LNLTAIASIIAVGANTALGLAGKDMAAKAKKNDKHRPKIVNRKAHHDYFVLETIEAGMYLLGTEIKSVRNGKVSLDEGFARINRDDELFLYGVDIAPYEQAGPRNHEPTRPRKLLVHKRQIKDLSKHVKQKGNTLIPMNIHFKRGLAKLELGLCRGKSRGDKRQTIKTREHKIEIARAMRKRYK